MKYELPALPYEYNALESSIDEATMRLHHTKHHQTYIDKLNAALEKHPELGDIPLETLLSDLNQVPEDIRTAVCNHGGGHWNHSFFWPTLRAPQENNAPTGPVLNALTEAFGSWENFRTQFTDKATTLFGSGWTWLVEKEGKLEIIVTPLQDTPLISGARALLGFDAWEHAYYLKYQNKRADYIEAFWKVVNWDKIEELLNNK